MELFVIEGPNGSFLSWLGNTWVRGICEAGTFTADKAKELAAKYNGVVISLT